MGTREDSGGGVGSGLRETTLWGRTLIPLSEAVEAIRLPPRPPSLSLALLLRRPLHWLILGLSQGVRGWREKKGPKKEQ